MRRKRAHSVLLVALLALSVNIAEATDPGTAQSPQFTLTITDSFSPYESVTYELKVRGSTYIAVLTKELVGEFGELQGLALVSHEAYGEAVHAIDACLRDERPSAALTAPFDGGDVRLLVRYSDSEHEYSGWIGELEPSSPLWCAASRLVETYRAAGDPVVFRNLFFDPGEHGELTADSVPRSHIYIDGVDSGLDTPARHIRLLVGMHEIRFVNDALGIDRTYEITIEAGLTTRLAVELR